MRYTNPLQLEEDETPLCECDNWQLMKQLFNTDNAREELAIEDFVSKFLRIPIQDLENFLDKY